jgi:small conductance mechanosensitive channel
VWHVPHGQIVRVANLSQEWAQTVVDVPVPRDADLAAVTDVLAELAGSLRTDPTVADSVLEDPTVVGVQAVRDDRVLVRVTVRTRPAGQWAVARALWTRLLAAEREGRLPAPPVAPFPSTG